MMRRGLRNNAFLVAAVSLPVVVVVFFVLASAIPRWRVPSPAYDLLLRAAGPYDQAPPRVTVDFNVRDGRVEATVRSPPVSGYPQPWTLFLFDHNTTQVREIAVDLPDMAEGDPPRTIVIDALAGRRVLAQAKAPDGYELETRRQRGPGIVGDLFGMHRDNQSASLVNRGRVVPIALPSPYEYQSPVHAVGWVVDRESP